MSLKSYSWEVRNEICAVKTVDKTLLLEGSTGIPMDVVPFFTGQLLDEQQEKTLEFSISGTLFSCTLSRKQTRHRLFLAQIKLQFAKFGVQIGDLLFFERDLSVQDRFNIAILDQQNEAVISPLSYRKVGEDRARYGKTRVGHEFFSEQVRLAHDYRCCLSGIDDTQPSILIASHIKPWSKSNGEEKLDVYNGLLLAPHYDKLFDQGFISFSGSGALMLSTELSEHLVEDWKLEGKKLHRVHPKTAGYLEFHRDFYGF